VNLDGPSAYPGWDIPPDGLPIAIPQTPSGWLVRGAIGLIDRFAGPDATSDAGEEPALDRLLVELASLAFSRGPMPMEVRAGVTWALASLWGLVIAAVMVLFVLFGWMTQSAAWVMTGFPLAFGLAFGEMMMWLVRWSVAVQRQKRTSDDTLGDFPTWSATEWLALIAGVSGAELVIFLANA
jgi:hypothetical protein